MKFASDELKLDREIILSGIKGGRYLFRDDVPEVLLYDKEFILAAVKENGDILKFLSDDYRDDKHLLIDAVKSSDSAFKYASARIKADKDFLLYLIGCTDVGSVFKFASFELKSDKDFVLQAVKRSGFNYKYISYELKYDREIFFAALESVHGGNAFEFAID